MVTFVLTVVTCICSFISMIALISISCSVLRLRDKFKASPQYDDEDDNFKVIPYDFDEKKSE